MKNLTIEDGDIPELAKMVFYSSSMFESLEILRKIGVFDKTSYSVIYNKDLKSVVFGTLSLDQLMFEFENQRQVFPIYHHAFKEVLCHIITGKSDQFKIITGDNSYILLIIDPTEKD